MLQAAIFNEKQIRRKYLNNTKNVNWKVWAELMCVHAHEYKYAMLKRKKIKRRCYYYGDLSICRNSSPVVYFVFLHFWRHFRKNCVTFVRTEKWVKNEDNFSAGLCEKGVAIKTYPIGWSWWSPPLCLFGVLFFFVFCVTNRDENDPKS